MRQNALVRVLQSQWNVLAALLAEGWSVRPFECRKVIDWMPRGCFSWGNLDIFLFSGIILVFFTGSKFISGYVLRCSIRSSRIVNWFVRRSFLLGDMGTWGVYL
jgi:hypothetical protein